MASPCKTIIITGANSGIGFEAAKVLTKQGHHVIMACRSKERTEEAIQQIKKLNPNAKCEFIKLDLANLSSIHEFADAFHQRELPLHVLVNNAGIMYEMASKERHLTDDGFEMTMATNHLGHFLMTHLLLEDLKSTATKDGSARIVNTSSSLHDPKIANMRNKYDVGPIDLDDLNLAKEGAYNTVKAYKNSKAANIMFTRKLARDLNGTGVICNCLCPGFIPRTGLTRHSGAMTQFMLKYFLDGFLKLFKKITRSPEEGGASIVYLATGEEISGLSGGYYTYDKLTEPTDEVKDESTQEKLWEISKVLLKME